MRLMLRLPLFQDGYTVVEVPTYTAALRTLRAAADPMVVVVGTLTFDFRAEAEFFGQIAAEAALAWRRRLVLLTTIQEWLLSDLDRLLCGLRVPVLAIPSHLHELLGTIALAAWRTLVQDEPVG
jgi:hypothetical protein